LTIENLDNSPPATPVITGPTNGKTGVELEYTFVSTDPDDDDIWYWINWGDGTTSDWIGPKNSGEEITVKHMFSTKGKYTINCKVKDVVALESGWGSLEVTIPRAKTSPISGLIDRFQNLLPILRYILKL